MAATASVLKKNLFNKARVRKAQLFSTLLNECFTCSYPNGNSGYEQSVIFVLAEIFPACVARKVYGDVHTMGHVTFDPSGLTLEDEAIIRKLIEMEDGLPVDEQNPRGAWKPHYEGADYHSWKKRRSVWQAMQGGCRGYYYLLIDKVAEMRNQVST